MDGQRVFGGIAVANYADATFRPLASTLGDLGGLTDAFRDRGYHVYPFDDPETPSDVLGDFAQLPRDLTADDALVLYWAGHGQVDLHGALRLVLGGTGASVGELESVGPGALVEAALASGAGGVFLVVDACYAGAGLEKALAEAAAWARTTETARWFCVVASAQAYQEAVGGRLAEMLVSLVRHGPTSDRLRYLWDNPYDVGVRGQALLEAIVSEWPYDGQQVLPATFGGADVIFLPNQHHEPTTPDRLVDPGQQSQFTGRDRLVAEIMGWLQAGRPGVRLLMGAPGAGKSAILDHVAALAAAEAEAEAVVVGPGTPDDGPGPDEGPAFTIAAAVRLRALDVDALIEKIGEAVGLVGPASIWELLERLSTMHPRPVLVVDALDEAIPAERGGIAADVLARLAEVAMVLVSSRDIASDADGTSPLAALSTAATPWDLDRDEDTEADIEQYVARRLEPTAHQDVATVATAVARRAAREHGGFLYARVVTDLLQHEPVDTTSPSWEDALDLSIPTAFEQAVAQRLEGMSAAEAGDVLTPLACAFGAGLPASEVWLRFARAVRDSRDYTLADIGTVLQCLGQFIVESGEGGRAVYRLFHRELGSHLLRAHDGLFERIDDAAGALWVEQSEHGEAPQRVDPYLSRSGSAHLVRRGEPGLFVARGLAAANPAEYRPMLANALVATWNARRIAGDRSGAAVAAEQALSLFRTLAADSATYKPALAQALVIESSVLEAAGRLDDAVDIGAEAVLLYRALVDEQGGAYLPSLADALVQLSGVLSETGGHDTAVESAREASEIYRALAAENAEAYEANFATSLISLTKALFDADRSDEAIGPAERAAAMLDAAASTNPDSYLPNLAVALNNLATIRRAAGRLDAAVEAGKDSVRIQRGLLDANPAIPVAGLAQALNTLAAVLNSVGGAVEAVSFSREAVDLYRRMGEADAADNPDNRGMALTNLADALTIMGRADEALPIGVEAVEVFRRSAALHPTAHPARLPAALASLSTVLMHVGRVEEAAELSTEAVELFRQLSPANRTAHLLELASALAAFSGALLNTGRASDAIEPATEAGDLVRALAASGSRLHIAVRGLALTNLSAALMDAGRHEDAMGPAGEAVDLLRRIADPDPSQRAAMATALTTLTGALTLSDRDDEAVQAGREAEVLLRELVETDRAQGVTLATDLLNLSTALLATDRLEEARVAAAEAADRFRQLVVTYPMVRRSLAVSLFNLSLTLRHLARPHDAAESARESANMLRELAEHDPVTFGVDLADALGQLARCLDETDHQSDAIAPSREAVTVYRSLVDLDPELYAESLADSLENLVGRLEVLERRDDLIEATGELVVVHRALVAAGRSPNDLAGVLQWWAVLLTGRDRAAEAVAPASEAVELFRQLAEDESASDLGELASALNTLSVVLGHEESWDEALPAAVEAVDLLRGLAATDQSPSPGALAAALDTLASSLLGADQPEAALAASRESVDLATRLVAADPETHEPLLTEGRATLARVEQRLDADPAPEYED